jgi:hypothetical protein
LELFHVATDWQGVGIKTGEHAQNDGGRPRLGDAHKSHHGH